MIDAFPIEREEILGIVWGIAAFVAATRSSDQTLVALAGAWGAVLSVAVGRRLARTWAASAGTSRP